MSDDEAMVAMADRVIDLEVIIRQARALTMDGDKCWADHEDGFHRRAHCLLCHIRAVLDDQPLPTEDDAPAPASADQ